MHIAKRVPAAATEKALAANVCSKILNVANDRTIYTRMTSSISLSKKRPELARFSCSVSFSFLIYKLHENYSNSASTKPSHARKPNSFAALGFRCRGEMRPPPLLFRYRTPRAVVRLMVVSLFVVFTLFAWIAYLNRSIDLLGYFFSPAPSAPSAVSRRLSPSLCLPRARSAAHLFLFSYIIRSRQRRRR